ncbi:MAG: response regulator [Verrucomicrobiota bacterium]|jgi:CheY-like chemotaxis protein
MKKPNRVLLVDDDTLFTGLVKLNLEHTGRFEVCVVNDPLDALTIARTFKPHIILLDVVMPTKDGGELLAELEGDEQLKNVPVMFMTASTTSQLARAQHVARRGRPVIAKPVEPKELARCINEALGVPRFGFFLNWGRKA